jgi:hypothetical protein
MPGSLIDSLSMGEVPGSIPGSARSFALPFALCRYITSILLDVVVLTRKVRDDEVNIRLRGCKTRGLVGDGILASADLLVLRATRLVQRSLDSSIDATPFSTTIVHG